jgi:protein-disulfide isomerase
LGLALFVVLGGGALAFLNYLGRPRPPREPVQAETRQKWDALARGARHAKGDANAPLTILEFADFECPSCRRAYESVLVGTLKKTNARFLFRHLPLTDLHPTALPAALAAEAAARQGKFWPMYEALFDPKAPELSPAYIEASARKIGLDLPRFRKDWADPALKNLVLGDRKAAADNGIETTPTFVVRVARTGEVLTAIGGQALQGLIENWEAGRPLRTPPSGLLGAAGGAPPPPAP